MPQAPLSVLSDCAVTQAEMVMQDTFQDLKTGIRALDPI